MVKTFNQAQGGNLTKHVASHWGVGVLALLAAFGCSSDHSANGDASDGDTTFSAPSNQDTTATSSTNTDASSTDEEGDTTNGDAIDTTSLAGVGTSSEPDDDSTMGQSGSEAVPDDDLAGADTVPCPCNAYAPALRVTVLDQEEDRLQLRVEEVVNIGNSIYGEPQVDVGDELDVSWDGRLPCYRGATSVETGEEALAFYSVAAIPADCEARDKCMIDCEANPDAFALGDGCGLGYDVGDDCLACCGSETERDCPAPVPDWTRGSVRLTPWTDDILFAQTDQASLAVPADELSELWNNDACYGAYGDWSRLPGAFESGVAP